jgi:predicted transcriptional regulator
MAERKKLLSIRENEVYNILLDEGGISAEEIAKALVMSKAGVLKVFIHLRQKGVTIRRFRPSNKKDIGCIYWVDEEDQFEDKPTYKADYKTRAEYGADLLKGVKKVAEVQTNRFLPEIKTFEFTGCLSIGIIFAADFHIGHQHGDYGAMEYVFDVIAKTPGLYSAFVGDMIDNSVNAMAPAGTTNIVDKDGQLAILESLFDKVTDKKKLLIMFEGNHEIRSVISDHFRITQYLANKQNSEYGNYGGQFIVTMNDIPIIIYCRHKMNGGSQFNPLHPNVRAPLFDSTQYASNADVIVRAHTHESAVGEFKVGAKIRYMMVCGNAVVYDDYADRVGFESMKWSMPMIIIRPDGTIRMYRRMKEGLEDLRDFREVEAEREEIEDDED